MFKISSTVIQNFVTKCVHEENLEILPIMINKYSNMCNALKKE